MSIASPRKPSVHERKRQAAHHRHSRDYLKTYWPYLPMLLIVLVGIAFNSFLNQGSHILGAQSDLTQASLLNLTNQDRVAANEAGLGLNSELNAAAQAKADDMVKNNYWAHISPAGATPWSFIDSSGYQYQAAGENLAYGFNNADSLIKAWMDSPPHRQNMLDQNYRDVGFGVAQSPNYLGKGPQAIVVAEYGEPVAAVTGADHPVAAFNIPAEATVSRLQLMTKSESTWLILAVTAIAGIGMIYFVMRHSLYMHKVMVKSEAYVVNHPFLDITIVLLCTVSVVLTHTVGLIG